MTINIKEIEKDIRFLLDDEYLGLSTSEKYDMENYIGKLLAYIKDLKSEIVALNLSWENAQDRVQEVGEQKRNTLEHLASIVHRIEECPKEVEILVGKAINSLLD